MFGFSLPKILFTVVVIMAVWYGFKWVSRLQNQREDEARDRLRRRGTARPSAASRRDPGPADPGPVTQELVACAVCGDFVPEQGARSCGRKDCPYPG